MQAYINDYCNSLYKVDEGRVTLRFSLGYKGVLFEVFRVLMFRK